MPFEILVILQAVPLRAIEECWGCKIGTTTANGIGATTGAIL
jgi:hypothetical protein